MDAHRKTVSASPINDKPMVFNRYQKVGSEPKRLSASPVNDKPMVHNRYQKVTADTKAPTTSHLSSTEAVEVTQCQNDKLIDIERIDRQDKRRETLIRLKIAGNKKDVIKTYCVDVCGYSPQDIDSDYDELSKPEVFKHYKVKLRDSVIKTKLKRTKEILDCMNKGDKFDVDKLLELSRKYTCNPDKIVEEIQRHKTYAAQLKIMVENKISNAHFRATVAYLKLNLIY